MPVKGGISPKSYRWFKCRLPAQRPLKRGIMDMRTVLGYRGMTEYLKMYIARGIAATKEHILNWFWTSIPDPLL